MLRNKHGFIAKIIGQGIKEGFLINAFAEEGEPGTEPTASTPSPSINYEDLIARARKEEKDKLYPKITKLEADNKALVEKHNQALLTIGTKDTEIAELKSQIEATKNASPSDSQEVAQYKAKIKELEGKVAEYEAQKVDPEAIREEIKAEYEVKLYKEQKLREVGDQLIPDLVFGNTKEEIDKSIEVSKTRYQEIASKFSQQVATQVPAVNVNTSTMTQKELNSEDISKMSPREWAEYRKSLGLR